MGILGNFLNSFKETIILKEDSDLVKQVEELKSIRNNVCNKNEIDKDIKFLELGIKGENEILYELKNANLGLYVLRDITIEYEDSTAQIDYVIISKGFTYLVECKNLIGNIYINNQGQFEREYEFNGKKVKEAIYSPYTQAVRHKEILKKRWLLKNSKLTVSVKEKYFDNKWYKPLVVIANSKSILNTKYAPKEIKNNVIRVDQLINYIKNDIQNYDKDILSNQKKMEEEANKWLEINVIKQKSILEKYKNNIENTKEKTENLIKELKQYRSEKSKSMNVPAYYIFTNDELEKIVNFKPKNVDELKTILSPVKIKCHGEEIIKIINNL